MNKYAPTKRPPLRGCPGHNFIGRPLFGLHQWNWSSQWNGNDRKVLPFWEGTSGVARSGWRCYHCGKFVWDQTDTQFALGFAHAVGLIKLPGRR